MDQLFRNPFNKLFDKGKFSVPAFYQYKPDYHYKWIWPDTETNFRENNVDGFINGYSESDITYIHNSSGFRANEFSDSSSIILVGCSITKGIGIPVHDTFSSIIGNYFHNLEVLNLGIGANNNDFMFNQACVSFKKLNIDIMIITWTYPVRSYFVDEKDINFFSPTFIISDSGVVSDLNRNIRTKYYESVYTDNTHLSRLISYVNHLDYIASILKKKIIHSFVLQNKDDIGTIRNYVDLPRNKLFNTMTLDKLARDRDHPGKAWNEKYALELLKVI